MLRKMKVMMQKVMLIEVAIITLIYDINEED